MMLSELVFDPSVYHYDHVSIIIYSSCYNGAEYIPSRPGALLKVYAVISILFVKLYVERQTAFSKL